MKVNALVKAKEVAVLLNRAGSAVVFKGFSILKNHPILTIITTVALTGLLLSGCALLPFFFYSIYLAAGAGILGFMVTSVATTLIGVSIRQIYERAGKPKIN